MIWDVLILVLVVVTATIIVTIDAKIDATIDAKIDAKIDAVIKVTLILVQKQKERHIAPVSEMDAMIHAAEASKDRQG